MSVSKTLPPMSSRKNTSNLGKMTKSSVNDFSQIDKLNFESELMKLEYTIVSKLEIEGDKYLKVINSLGHKHYIWLNQPGYINYDHKIVCKPSSQDISIDYSLKSGTLSLMNFDISGYIFECGLHGIIMITRDENFDNVEKSYLYEGSIYEKTFGMEDVVIYPMVKINEVLSNNNIILSSINKICTAIDNDHYKNMKFKFEELKNQQLELIKNFQNLVAYVEGVEIRLNNRFECAININNSYADIDVIQDIDRKNYKKLKYNLAITQDLRNKINQTLNQFILKYQDGISELSKLNGDYFQFLIENYHDLNKIY